MIRPYKNRYESGSAILKSLLQFILTCIVLVYMLNYNVDEYINILSLVLNIIFIIDLLAMAFDIFMNLYRKYQKKAILPLHCQTQIECKLFELEHPMLIIHEKELDDINIQLRSGDIDTNNDGPPHPGIQGNDRVPRSSLGLDNTKNTNSDKITDDYIINIDNDESKSDLGEDTSSSITRLKGNIDKIGIIHRTNNDNTNPLDISIDEVHKLSLNYMGGLTDINLFTEL